MHHHPPALPCSPFAIPQEDIDSLSTSRGFQLLRDCLAVHTDFCDYHQLSSPQDLETWRLHRDILHALVIPVVELFNRASTLAAAALCTARNEDLELAFAGEARNAFVWLQCFVGEEEDWCRTRGCPATLTLSTESHIRLTIAASILSTSHRPTTPSSPSSSRTPSMPSSPTSSPSLTHSSEESPSSQDNDQLSLPPFPQILPALRSALSSDPFWGPDFWDYFVSRASQLSTGIQSLIADCANLESLVLSPSPSRTSKTTTTAFYFPTNKNHSNAPAEHQQEEKGLRLKKSKLAKRQLRMKHEEMELMRRCALQCWAKAAMPSQARGEILGLERSARRARSLTAP